jgi:phosphotransferase system enzyme I (PtsI)
MTKGPATEEKKLRGIAVYPDIVIGKAHLIDRSKVKILYRYLVNREKLEREVERLVQAYTALKTEVKDIRYSSRNEEKEKDDAPESTQIVK